MTQAVSTQRNDVRALIQSDKVKDQLAMVLPKYLTPDRMARVACSAVMRTPKLMQCEPSSLLQAIMLCAQAGLEPDGRNAHLIPFGKEVQVIFDYKGLVALARRNGVLNIAAELVCEKDKFEWWRDSEGLHFEHRVDWRSPRGTPQAVFCTWNDGGQFDGEVMTLEEVEAIRKRSFAWNNGPWVTDYNEMAKKTVIRRASKRWPIASETAEALQKEAEMEFTKVSVKPDRPNFLTALPEPAEPEPVDDSNPDLAPSEPEQQQEQAAPRRGRPPGSRNKPKDEPSEAVQKPSEETYGNPFEELDRRMDEAGMSFDMLLAADREAGNRVPGLQDVGGMEELSSAKVKCILAEWERLMKGGEK